MNYPAHYFNLISDDQLDAIHENTLRIMKEVGIVMPYDHAKELLKAHGCTVEGDLVKFPREVVEEAIKTAPDHYTLYSRNPDKNVEISCYKVSTAGPYGSPFVTDFDRGRRRSKLSDFIEIAKIVDKCDAIDIQSHIHCEPGDVPEPDRPLTMVYYTNKYSEKPGMSSIFGYEAAMQGIELSSIPFGGLEAIKEKPVVASIPCTLTPLSYDPRQLGAIRAFAETGQVQLINSLSIAGMTTPVTLAGLVSVQNAEVLAGITYAQLVNPGCPVVYSASGSNSDMASGLLCIGTPEDHIVSLVNGQLAKRYQIPCRISGALSDSKLMDAQAAYESAITIGAAYTAGGNFILHSAGIIETYNCTSFEKIIIDNEILNYWKRIYRGIDVDEETLAFDVIDEVGPQGAFLAEDHTFEHFRDEFYMQKLSNRQAHDVWESKGGLSCEQRANAMWHKYVEESTSELGADVERDMKKYVEDHIGHEIYAE
ncbi:MAG: trimethylamine methyltransferase family protein [Coriobacteriales bacterium]|nr:trimethylamine methyltransferase family protein [Coriobacteriales bacterium]